MEEKNEEKKGLPIQDIIYEVRGQKVMLDRDLAELYEVELKMMNQAVKRNIKRFPSDFMFQLTDKEWAILRCQFGTANGRSLILRSQIVTAKKLEKVRYNPYVFTEQGIAMLSGLLSSDIAIQVNIEIMRAFIRLRHYALSQNGTNEQIVELKKFLMIHIENNEYEFYKHDESINKIIKVLDKLIDKPKPLWEQPQSG